jgi:hypothetical protein
MSNTGVSFINLQCLKRPKDVALNQRNFYTRCVTCVQIILFHLRLFIIIIIIIIIIIDLLSSLVTVLFFLVLLLNQR